ncbi:MAG: AtpZ/AtpI family protein [Nitrospirota bacterium]|nr:AtpZ/AtpI family protein [Nitrospirota bacterium]
MDRPPEKYGNETGEFRKEVGRKEARRLKARKRGEHSVWFGLGMFGIIGWSIAVPTLLGIALGIWLDRRWTDRISWTLTLMITGVIVGCINAWFWVSRERKDMEEEINE